MIRHVVMWKLKDHAEGADALANAARLKAELEGLRAAIPQIRALEVGITLGRGGAAWDLVLISDFDSEADLTVYQEHPEHRRVAELVGRLRAERAVVDFTPGGTSS